MRIIGGKFKGRRFSPPADSWPTRPTTDFAKEGLFNILNNRLDFIDIKALDLFGGTGNHAYELISRGCTNVTYVDKHPPAIQFVREAAVALHIADQIHIFPSDVFKFIERCVLKYDYIFAGPPYGLPGLDIIPDKIFDRKMLEPDGLLVLEHNPHHNFQKHAQFLEARNYGKTIFSFFTEAKQN